MNKLAKKFLFLFLIIPLAAIGFSGCGGGSAGTGTTTFTGKLLTTDNQPVEGAVVRVVGSGDIATTDAQGQFVLSTANQDIPHELQVQAQGVDASVVVPAATADESKIGVQLELDTSNATVSITSVEVKVTMIGNCAKYFLQEDQSIVQIKHIPDQTLCTFQVAANSGTRPVGGILAELQRNTCNGPEGESESWIAVASGRTRESGSRGRVDVKFTFFDDEAHCRYRVVAPSGDKNRTPLFFPIVTIRETRG
jgi:hypothetical protein